MKFHILKPGLLSTIQDTGRHGHQNIGMPTSGAMDQAALAIGNHLLGNPQNAAAIEITLLGPTIAFAQKTHIVIAGPGFSPKINHKNVPLWTVIPINPHDVLSFGPPPAPYTGFRAYICLSGGVDVPQILGSRSTYLKGQTGGFHGRPLKTGDILSCLPTSNAPNCGTFCPPHLLPSYHPQTPLRAIPGPQYQAFTSRGIQTFQTSQYLITPSSDRMGYRLSGPKIEHQTSPDIISEAVPQGSIQIASDGQPIIMTADRQTTGGYTKIAILATADLPRLAQLKPAETIKFQLISQEQALSLLHEERQKLNALKNIKQNGNLNLKINGKPYHVTWEKL